MDNHSNHFKTIASLMQIRRLDVLDSLIPWVYKTYLSHGVGKRYFPVIFGLYRQAVGEGVFVSVTLAMMIHSHSKDSFVRYRALALDPIKFTFRGKTAHAAGAPWDGLNALNGLQLFFHAIDMLRQHVKPDVRIHGIVISGGTAPNIVPVTPGILQQQ
jgi:hypothetical protein